MACPICKKDMVVSGALHEDGDEKCPDGHYHYNHSYGCHELFLDAYGDGHVQLSIGWHYTETREAADKRNEAIQKFTEYAKILRRKE